MPSCRRGRPGRARRRAPTARSAWDVARPGPVGQQLRPRRAVGAQEAAGQLGAGILERPRLRRQAEDGAAALAPDDREHAADPGRAPQRRVHVVAVAALAPPQQLPGRRSRSAWWKSSRGSGPSRRLSWTASLTRSSASIAEMPSSVFQALPTTALAASSSGGSSPAVKIARSSRGHGQRRAADARHEHQLAERLRSDVGARGERERGGAGRRVLQSHHGGGPRPSGRGARSGDAAPGGTRAPACA